MWARVLELTQGNPKVYSVNLWELRHKSLDNLSVQVMVAAAPESFRLSGQHCINMDNKQAKTGLPKSLGQGLLQNSLGG